MLMSPPVLKSHMVCGRNNLLSLSVDSDNSLPPKLLLCVEMVLCSGLTIIDRSLLSTHHSATDIRRSSSASIAEPFLLNSLSRCEASVFLMVLLQHTTAYTEGHSPSESDRTSVTAFYRCRRRPVFCGSTVSSGTLCESQDPETKPSISLTMC